MADCNEIGNMRYIITCKSLTRGVYGFHDKKLFLISECGNVVSGHVKKFSWTPQSLAGMEELFSDTASVVKLDSHLFQILLCFVWAWNCTIDHIWNLGPESKIQSCSESTIRTPLNTVYMVNRKLDRYH